MDSAVAMSSRLVAMRYVKPGTHAQYIYYFIPPGFKFTELHALTLATHFYALLSLGLPPTCSIELHTRGDLNKLPCNHGNYHFVIIHWPHSYVYFALSHLQRSY